MPKLVEIKLHRLTCEFADDEPGPLAITGNLVVLAYDIESDIKRTEVLYNFPNGPIHLRKGESKEINADVRMGMNLPSQDYPLKLAPDFVKFGGELKYMGGNW
jgi:hypothetical protein